MLPPGVESKGHLVIKSLDGSPLPQVVAKTYNVDAHGGTFGQNLKVFGESDLIYFGESGYIAGVSNSSDNNLGFRTNVGVLNTSEDNTATINIHIYIYQALKIMSTHNQQHITVAFYTLGGGQSESEQDLHHLT